ncbi:23S rRNA (uracil(1939)-C(5))-methyltransferase RlmD [Paenibacillus guangzhouensis]|uniref:23S rRNA (uracil(1939)-C(5))-methyltransferase RlmD n=1 Tax=Paenibacillus guangzhouensis TaxID=1473112 RepID=UPI001267791A|nr:23S rRNA (uracil(1939)-C(5))-methyltransferase RlmD [Paenibacillus guangzhouensis]
MNKKLPQSSKKKPPFHKEQKRPLAAGGQKPRPSTRGDQSAELVSIGERIIVTIKRIGINGEGVGYFRRKAVFVDGALPEEVVRAKVKRIEPNFIIAELMEIEKKSAARIKPDCPVYDRCGGCQLQHLSYAGQLSAKEDIVREAFNRYTQGIDVKIKPILGMDNPWKYRNKAQLQLGFQGDQMIAGLYEAGSHQLVDITGCAIQHPTVNQAVDTIKGILMDLHIPVFKARGGDEGYIRNIVVRAGQQSGELQVTLVTGSEKMPKAQAIVSAIRRVLPQVTTIAHNINTQKTSLIFGDKTHILWGRPTINDSLGDLQFELSPRAFFQLNPEQTVKLYEAVRVAAGLTGRETVVDAYCGTGTIGLWLAPYAREVRGIEIIPEAVEDAKRNAERSGRTNANFYVGKSEELLPRWVKQGFQPDVVVFDPPRTGVDSRLLRAITQTKPKKLVYVSCNPSTLAKDCKQLIEGGYELQWVQPVDMFPQTSHVECCVSLVRT